MTRRIRRLSLSVVAALVLASAGSSPAPAGSEAVPVPQYIIYWSDWSRTQMVGEGEWSCSGTYTQYWGTSSSYSDHYETDCGPIDPW
jgi:hypothetical protein